MANILLPEDEQREFVWQFPYKGWDNIEQLEDIIGEENACALHFDEVDGKGIEYDLEIIIRRVKRTTTKD